MLKKLRESIKYKQKRRVHRLLEAEANQVTEGHGRTSKRLPYLPSDVLFVIFEEACLQTSTGHNTFHQNVMTQASYHFELPNVSRRERCFVSLIRLTQVCSYWREVALDTALLWNRVNLPARSSHLLDLHIQRSRHAGLDVSVNYSMDEILNAQFDAFLRKHMYRIRSLYIYVHHPRSLVLPDCLAPSLTSLFVDARNTTYNNARASRVQMLTVAPNLHQTSLHSIKPSILPSNLGSITHLVLTNLYRVPDADIIDFAEMLGILTQCQGLVEMEIDICTSKDAVFAFSVEKIIFPNLRLLRLHNKTHHEAHYPLALFETPSLRDLCIDNCTRAVPLVCDLLPTSLVNLSLLDVQAAKITHPNARTTMSFELYSDLDFNDVVFSCTQYVPYDMRHILRDFFHEVIQAHGLTSITSLQIHSDPIDYYAVPVHALEFGYLESLPDIHSIVIEGTVNVCAKPNSLGSDFFSSVIEMQRLHHGSLILPQLEDMAFRNIVCQPIYDYGAKKRYSLLAVDKMVAFLRFRAEHGKKLKSLNIHNNVVHGGWRSSELELLVGTLKLITE